MTAPLLARAVTKSPKVHLVIRKGGTDNTTAYTDLAPTRMRINSAPYIRRIKADNEVRAQTRNIWTEELYMGEELNPFEGRPGSMDAYSLPSHGDRT